MDVLIQEQGEVPFLAHEGLFCGVAELLRQPG
jgi:hypothetical protein